MSGDIYIHFNWLLFFFQFFIIFIKSIIHYTIMQEYFQVKSVSREKAFLNCGMVGHKNSLKFWSIIKDLIQNLSSIAENAVQLGSRIRTSGKVKTWEGWLSISGKLDCCWFCLDATYLHVELEVRIVISLGYR